MDLSILREDEIDKLVQLTRDRISFRDELVSSLKARDPDITPEKIEKTLGPEPKELNSVSWMEPIFQTFNIKCKRRLSSKAKNILLGWNNQPFYWANEDILYLLKSNLIEQDFLLNTLHSMVIFLQNATCASFFHISIYNVIITSAKTDQNYDSSGFVESITFKLHLYVTLPPEKEEVSW